MKIVLSSVDPSAALTISSSGSVLENFIGSCHLIFTALEISVSLCSYKAIRIHQVA